MMRVLVLLMMIFGVTCSEGDESTGPPEAGSTCEDFRKNDDLLTYYVLEGEALRLLPHNDLWNSSEPNRFTWHRQTQLGDSQISSEEKRVHHHGPALFFLSLSLNDSGNYIARDNYEGKCRYFNISVRVVPTQELHQYLHTTQELTDSNPKINCPENVVEVCEHLAGSLHWYRKSVLIEGENKDTLRILMATEADSGLYKCLCTWTHDGKKYTSSASREEFPDSRNATRIPKTIGESPVLPQTGLCSGRPTASGSSPGFPLTINCKAYCGINVRKHCNVRWKKNNHSVSGMEGYHQNFSSWMDSSKHSYSSATLTINKVQTSDLHTSFRCLADHYDKIKSHTLILKPAESLTNLGVALVCVSIVCLLATIAIKYLAVDLVLFFRSFLRFTKTHSDGSQYDVYVVYQSQQDSKAIEEVLNQFLSQALPLVLEQKCGYRVFIHGRDDIPGEARFHLNNISRLLPSLTDSMAETLIHAFITSHLDCCNGVLSRVPNRALERLQDVHNSTAKVISRKTQSLAAHHPHSHPPPLAASEVPYQLQDPPPHPQVPPRPRPSVSHRGPQHLHPPCNLCFSDTGLLTVPHTRWQTFRNKAFGVALQKEAEDPPYRFEQVQERVKLSRRLMVVLTPGSEVNETLDSSPISPWGMDVNWQVVLYQALVQEIRVILVQLGELGPQGYTNLSVTLQHLIRKCAPLCWREDMPGAANWKSRFWKRVRYAMPTAPRKPFFHVV
ncbi:Interleukin-1 receptor-like 1 [Merluccius polli]|uniref:Interleukin-1 receptor-like 1 n=1 Tax=Merluccius polli TaxID=89951 RepID=A0AA47MMU7_MERPO|nr:Interleukin-1 receptor-like 1 [Merluccius polli]